MASAATPPCRCPCCLAWWQPLSTLFRSTREFHAAQATGLAKPLWVRLGRVRHSESDQRCQPLWQTMRRKARIHHLCGAQGSQWATELGKMRSHLLLDWAGSDSAFGVVSNTNIASPSLVVMGAVMRLLVKCSQGPGRRPWHTDVKLSTLLHWLSWHNYCTDPSTTILCSLHVLVCNSTLYCLAAAWFGIHLAYQAIQGCPVHLYKLRPTDNHTDCKSCRIQSVPHTRRAPVYQDAENHLSLPRLTC